MCDMQYIWESKVYDVYANYLYDMQSYREICDANSNVRSGYAKYDNHR